MNILFLNALKSDFLIIKTNKGTKAINIMFGIALNPPSRGKKKINKQNKNS